MAVPHGSGAEVLLSSPTHAVDASEWFHTMEMPRTADTAPTSHFKASAKEYVPSEYEDCTINADGNWEGGTGKVDEILDALLGDDENGDGASLWSYSPEGGAQGDLVYCAQAIETEYGIPAETESAVQVSASAQSIVGRERATRLHALGSESSDGSGSSVDNGSSTADGGSAYLHATAIPSGTLTAKVQHSSDDSTFTDLATFSGISSPAGERVEIADGTTIERYTRVSFTLGGGSATFAVDLHRNT